MSSERSSSAVRSLRSLFENKASESSSDLRGRSPGGLSDIDFQRPRSKVRTNFIPVELSKAIAARAEMEGVGSELHKESSVDDRRGSFSGGQSGKALEGVVMGPGAESALSSTAATPLVEINKQLGVSGGSQKQDKPAANPDKPVTGVEEDPTSITPADPASEAAVSGGKGLPSAAEDLRKSKKPLIKPSTNGRPSMSLKDTTKPSTKSSGSQPKSPLSPLKAPSKKPSRSSLTAPTAASAARASAAEKANSSAPGKVSSPPSKIRPREVTKPVELSSHLTAPTAASRARQDPTPAASTASRAKAATSARAAPRASLAGRPESGASQTSKGKPSGSADGSFLDRMTRPTAASSNKSHQEKTEVKSPSRKPASAAPKPSAVPKTSKPTSSAPKVPKTETELKPASSKAPAEKALVGEKAKELEPSPAVGEVSSAKEEPETSTNTAVETAPAPEPAPEPAAEPEPTPAEPVETQGAGAEEAKPEPAVEAKQDPVAETKLEPAEETQAEPVVEAKPEPVAVPKTIPVSPAPAPVDEAPVEPEAPKANGEPTEVEKVEEKTDAEPATQEATAQTTATS